VSSEDFKWGLYDYGVHLTDEEFDLVLGAFDRNNDGMIDFTEFLVTLRGDLSPARLVLIEEAFRRLDKDGSGVVTLSDLVAVYSTKFHPEVIAGRKTHEQAVTEFMSQWDTKDKDGIITYDEFVEYYKVCARCAARWLWVSAHLKAAWCGFPQDVSASIDRDDYFELMMR
jgi:calcyphosin